MPDGKVWTWTQQNTTELFAALSGSLVGFLGLVAAFLIGFALLSKISR